MGEVQYVKHKVFIEKPPTYRLQLAEDKEDNIAAIYTLCYTKNDEAQKIVFIFTRNLFSLCILFLDNG